MTVKTNDIVSRFRELADLAVRGGETITISRPRNENVVLVSEAEYKELSKNRHNVEYLEMLRESLEDIKAGRVVVKSIEELQEMESSME